MPNSEKARFVIGRFVEFLVPYWFQGLIVLLCMVCVTVGSLAPPYITKIIIDDLLPARQLFPLMIALSVLLGIIGTRLVLSFVSDYLYAWVGIRVVRDMRTALFQHLLYLPLSFHLQLKTGDLVFRLNNDVGAIQSVLTSSVLRFLHHILSLIGLVIILCWLNAKLFLFCIAVIPFFVANLIYFRSRIQKIVESIQQQGAGLSTYVIERFNNVPLIQLSNCDRHETTRFRSVLDNLIESVMRNVTYSLSMGTISSGLTAVTPAIVLAWGGYQVMQEAMTLGTLVAFIQYTSRLFGPLRGLQDLYIGLVRGLVSMRRVLEFLQVPTQIQTHTGRKQFVYDRKIEFQDVHFSFKGNEVLQGVDLKLEKGKAYGLVGRSGSGKTTLANLLCGFYRPTGGRILIDDVPIQEIGLTEIRRHVGLVSQHVHLFHDSIWANVRYGNFACEPEDIERLIRQVGLSGVNLQSQIGEQGVQVSGGQKQRIAMARALLRPVELLILDEATGALDPESEGSVFQQVRNSLHGKTLLVISHRLSVLRDMDEVICLANGLAVEQGPPESLLNSQGFYRRFCHQRQEQKPDTLIENAG